MVQAELLLVCASVADVALAALRHRWYAAV